MTRTIRMLALAAALTVGVTGAASAQAMRGGFNANALAGNDDGSTDLVSIGFTLNFFGSYYNNAYLNNNGNMTFLNPMSTYTPFPIVGNGIPMIAPFFADVDTRAGALMEYGAGSVGSRNAFGVTWNGVCFFYINCTRTNAFQLVLIDRADIAAGDFDIEFNYDYITWETGDASGGSGGMGGSCARAGWTNGDITTPSSSYELTKSGTCGALVDGGTYALTEHTNANLAGRYVFNVRNGNIEVPPETPVPEPVTMVLLGTGLFGVAAARRRTRKDDSV